MFAETHLLAIPALFLLGAALGLIYISSLGAAILMFIECRTPGRLLLLLYFFIQIATTVSCLYLLSAGRLEKLISLLAGFMCMRKGIAFKGAQSIRRAVSHKVLLRYGPYRAGRIHKLLFQGFPDLKFRHFAIQNQEFNDSIKNDSTRK
ncbi:MAG: ATP synthase subunit I [Syntrophales bacterium]